MTPVVFKDSSRIEDFSDELKDKSGVKVVDVESLRKHYGKIAALDGVSLSLTPGEVLGILGPNGAGKTTLVEILYGLRQPDGGRAVVFGVDVTDGLDPIRRRLGVSMQRTALPGLLRVGEVARLYGAIFGRPDRVPLLLDSFGLGEARQMSVGRLSGGQLQRLAVCLAFMGDPDLLFLDEPTSELDPHGRRAVWDMLRSPERRKSRSVILTTHQMEEAETVCDRIIILDHGRILAEGTPADLIQQWCPGKSVRFVVRGHADLSLIEGIAERSPDSAGNTVVLVKTLNLEKTMHQILLGGERHLYSIEGMRVQGSTLEDVFLHLTGRRIRE